MSEVLFLYKTCRADLSYDRTDLRLLLFEVLHLPDTTCLTLCSPLLQDPQPLGIETTFAYNIRSNLQFVHKDKWQCFYLFKQRAKQNTSGLYTHTHTHRSADLHVMTTLRLMLKLAL